MAFGNATKGYVKSHSGGGGGGTSNYNDLSNKPQINGVSLTGNKTSEELNIGGDITLTQCNIENEGESTKIFVPKNAKLVTFSIINSNIETYRVPYALSIKSIETAINNGWSIAALTHTATECIISVLQNENFYILTYNYVSSSFRMRDVFYI